MSYPLAFVTIISLCLAAPSQGLSQIVGPGPEQGDLEIGAWRSFHTMDLLEKHELPRGVEEELQRDVDGDRAGLMLRYGITDRIYALLNFGAVNWVKNEGEPNEWHYYTTVLGIGGGIRLGSVAGFTVHLGGFYNDLIDIGREGWALLWRGRDARIVGTLDRAFECRRLRLNLSAGPTFVYYRAKYFDRYRFDDIVRSRNRHPLSMLTAAMVDIFDRVNGGLELTWGAITEWRWRVHVRL